LRLTKAEYEEWSSLPRDDGMRAVREWHQLRDKTRRQKSRAFVLLGAAKARAEDHGVLFTITVDWVLERLSAGKCEVTGLPFRWSGVVGLRSSFSASVDRREPALGYTPENSRLVVWCYNSAKSSGTDEDVMKMAEALVRQKALKDGTAGP
jgi:hypothetical protein